MIINEELYKRMVLHLAEINNCYTEEAEYLEKQIGITWMELHKLRKEIEDGE